MFRAMKLVAVIALATLARSEEACEADVGDNADVSLVTDSLLQTSKPGKEGKKVNPHGEGKSHCEKCGDDNECLEACEEKRFSMKECGDESEKVEESGDESEEGEERKKKRHCIKKCHAKAVSCKGKCKGKTGCFKTCLADKGKEVRQHGDETSSSGKPDTTERKDGENKPERKDGKKKGPSGKPDKTERKDGEEKSSSDKKEMKKRGQCFKDCFDDATEDNKRRHHCKSDSKTEAEKGKCFKAYAARKSCKWCKNEEQKERCKQRKAEKAAGVSQVGEKKDCEELCLNAFDEGCLEKCEDKRFCRKECGTKGDEEALIEAGAESSE